MNDDSSAYDFYDKKQYFDELVQRINQTAAGSRILLMSMTLEPDEPRIAAILHSLEAAGSRGVQVTLGIDAHSFLIDQNQLGPLWYHTRLPERIPPLFARKWAALQRIEAHPNVRIVILNQPKHRFSLPVKGRSHIKIGLVDNYIYIGGCNLDRPDYLDLMVGWQDTAAADILFETLIPVIDAGSARLAYHDQDQTITINNNTKLLLDSGVPNQSVILDSALKLIDSATDWLVITCQFFPNSITAKYLAAAKRRGVRVDIVFAHPSHHGMIGGSGQRVSIALERSRLPASMFDHILPAGQPMLHAKLIACDKGMMIGSHNYVRAGVKLGTAEIALTAYNPALAQKASSRLKAIITI